MLIEISKVIITDRIRKDYGDIEELANDIKENGLINPPVVTPDFELVAGARRLRAIEYLGYEQVEVRIIDVKDYEHKLKIEISENENRKDFTKLERLDYARELERIERVKAKERQEVGTNQYSNSSLRENFPQGSEGRTRDIVAEKVGIGSGRQYEKEKHIAENADEKTLEKWNKGEITTGRAYKITRDKEKKAKKIEDKKSREVKAEESQNNSDIDRQTNIKQDVFAEKYKFKLNEFKDIINACTVAINPFIFMDNIYEKMEIEHKKVLLNEVSKLEEDIEDLKKQILFHGGIVNE